jgi:hypothetical protein
MLPRNAEEKEYTFTPLIFCGRRYRVTWWQSAIIALLTALLWFSTFFVKFDYMSFCHKLCFGNDFVVFWVFWLVECFKNHILLFALRVSRI